VWNEDNTIRKVVRRIWGYWSRGRNV
jgi:hypothetical protein